MSQPHLTAVDSALKLWTHVDNMPNKCEVCILNKKLRHFFITSIEPVENCVERVSWLCGNVCNNE